MRISDWSSDVCSSDLREGGPQSRLRHCANLNSVRAELVEAPSFSSASSKERTAPFDCLAGAQGRLRQAQGERFLIRAFCSNARSEEHTSELQSLMRISYAVFCLKKTTT